MVELQRLEKDLRSTSHQIRKDPCLARRLSSQDNETSQLSFSEGLGESSGRNIDHIPIGMPDSPLSPASRAMSLCASLNRDSFCALLETRSWVVL